jgi:ubiquinone/menaquinone biosynthesis C-methylase UbiE
MMRTAWDSGARGWYEHRAVIRDWLSDATAAMLNAAQLSPGQRVLDLAAGAGDQTLDLLQRVGQHGEVLLTDLSPHMLELALTQLRAAGHHNVRTQVADLQLLALGGADFDAAICRMGLMFCNDPQRALREIHAALAPGGRFSALVFSGPQQNPCITTLMNIARRHADLALSDEVRAGSLLSLGRAGLLEHLLRDAGFVDVTVQTLSAPFRLARVEDYIAFVRSSASPVIELLNPLSEEAQQLAWQEITEQLRRFETPHGWEGPNELLLGSARTPPGA